MHSPRPHHRLGSLAALVLLLLAPSPAPAQTAGATTTTYQQPVQQEEGMDYGWIGLLGLLGLAGLRRRKDHAEVRRTTTAHTTDPGRRP